VHRHNPPSVWQVPDPFRGIYSHAVELPAGARTLLVSGQIGVAPDGELKRGFAHQCEQAMDNVEALLAAAGMTRGNIAKLTFLLTRAEDLATLGEIRRRRWSTPSPPAITTYVVAALANPDYLIEIEALAAAA
jgi:enamine deaminase RidA (YjgF/YER057c/UK114 family)